MTVAWTGWVVFWIAAALWGDRALERARRRAELGYRAIMLAGGLVFVLTQANHRPLQLWHLNRNETWICAGLIVIGLTFSIWARIYLGRLWSGSITLKANHRVVSTGPYSIVRHPIYTGLLVAMCATMVVNGTASGFAMFVLVTLGIWMKARLEEQWLHAQLADNVYEMYCRKVPMLMPFI